jgi:hypothetical protein
MTNRVSLPAVGLLNAAAILAFGVMIVIQIAGGDDQYPTVPPGLVISVVVVALLVLGARWWWTGLIGALWPIFLTVGAIASSNTRNNLGNTNDGFLFTTTLIQMLILAVALVAGVLYAVERVRGRGRVSNRVLS